MTGSEVIEFMLQLVALVSYMILATGFAMFWTQGDLDSIEMFVAGFMTAAMGVVLGLVVWIVDMDRDDRC